MFYAVGALALMAGAVAFAAWSNGLADRCRRYEEWLVKAGIDPRTGSKIDARIPLPTQWRQWQQ